MAFRYRIARARRVAEIFALVLLVGCGASAPDRQRVTLIGVDGAAWRVIDPLLERGELPQLARLLETGLRAPLRSEKPISSPPIWTTVATGVSRERHGIDRFFAPEGRLFRTSDRRVPALWNLAAQAGLTSAVIGWWITYPAEEIPGVMIAARALETREGDLRAMPRATQVSDARPSRLAHPPEALAWLASSLSVDPAVAADGPEQQRIVPKMQAEDAAVAETLLRARRERGPFDLEMILLRGVDPVSHFFWRYHEPGADIYTAEERPDPADVERFGGVVEAHYRFVDALLGRIVEEGAGRVIFVVSDHGFEAGRQPFRDDEVLSGKHRSDAALDGILIAAGGPIRPGVELARASIYDLAPTLLHLLGLPVPTDLDGQVLAAGLDPAWMAQHPVRTAPRYAPPSPVRDAGEGAALDAELEERLREELRALGYVE